MDILLVTLYFSILLFFDKKTASLTQKKAQIVEIFVSFIVLFLFFCLRDLPVLNDTAHYYRDFLYRLQGGELLNCPFFSYDPYERFEFGFILYLRFIARYITTEPYSVILICGLIVTVANITFAKKFTNKICLFVFLMLVSRTLFLQYSACRQAIAIAIFYVSLFELIKGRRLIYIILMLLAYMFHRSALIMIIPLILERFVLNNKKTVLLFVGALILSPIIATIVSYINPETSYLEVQSERQTTPFATLANAAMLAWVLWNAYYLKKKYSLKMPYENTLLWIGVFCLAVQIESIQFLILSRYTGYFTPVIWAVLVAYYEQVSHLKQAKRKMFLICSVYTIYFIVTLIYRPEWSHVLPYSWFDFTSTYHEFEFGY